VIQRLNRETPRLHQRLLEKWHRSLKEADDWLADLNFGNARQRVAGLILKMRSEHDASVATLFSREDMGAMLDLKLPPACCWRRPAPIAFSGKAIIVKLAYRHGVDAVTLIMYRMLFALPLFLAMAWWATYRQTTPGPNR
jgi:hypothetical protein